MNLTRRMWRAFWVAMREGAKVYAPDKALHITVSVDASDAEKALQRLRDSIRSVAVEKARLKL